MGAINLLVIFKTSGSGGVEDMRGKICTYFICSSILFVSHIFVSHIIAIGGCILSLFLERVGEEGPRYIYNERLGGVEDTAEGDVGAPSITSLYS
jgi:hypothetical protein